MFNAIIGFSIAHRHAVLVCTLLLSAIGAVSYQFLVIDAVPDITNVQVQINTAAPGMSPFEVEQRITAPIELALAGVPKLESHRSLSRYGLSQVTVIFQEGTEIHFARNLISQRLGEVRGKLPENITPTMGPITTGLGEIVMYTVGTAPGTSKTLQELREVQDWVVRPQLRTVRGVSEVNSIGGATKQVVIGPNPLALRAHGMTFDDLSRAVARGTRNVGAGFLEQQGEQFLIRVPSQPQSLQDLASLVVGVHNSHPIYLKDLASVEIGSELRTGAATQNGSEVVLGTVFMLMGENGRDVALRVGEKIQEIQRSLPAGIEVKIIYDRSVLVNASVDTVKKNLLEGALLVVAILFIALGNFRAALITASVIPIAMVLTIFGMVKGGISANLMSLGALDFGLIVDGAVILVENCIRRLTLAQKSGPLSSEQRLGIIQDATFEVRQATMFGELIIMVVYIPILTLTGVEGKMFHPMAITVLLALLVAFIASLTFVPAAVAVFLNREVSEHAGVGGKILAPYSKLLSCVLRFPRTAIVSTFILLISSIILFRGMGAEFIPYLDEGDVALHALRIPGTSLAQSISMQHQLEKEIKKLPEVASVFAKIGTAEIATDPMPPSVADGFVILKPRSEWGDPHRPKSDVVADLEKIAYAVPGNNYEFTQPIQMRFNELIAGVRSDVAVKLFGDDSTVLNQEAEKIKSLIETVPGAADVKIEQTTGLPMVTVTPKREALGRFGLTSQDIQDLVSAAYAGSEVSRFYEGDRNFPIVIRLPEQERHNLAQIAELPIKLPDNTTPPKGMFDLPNALPNMAPEIGQFVVLSQVADVSVEEGPNQISREEGKRRVVVTANVRGRDLGGFVAEAQQILESKYSLPAGYWLRWGGQFEHLLSAQSRLKVIVPLVIFAVFGLIYLTLKNFTSSLLVFTGVPFALTGGVVALWLRGIPFSISAAVGFIALSGISVLNGLVLVTFVRRQLAGSSDIARDVVAAASQRLRPVCMTALVASLGFIPMAISQGTGSEVQRPLATVVIGGILSSTALTLCILPLLLVMTEKWRNDRGSGVLK